MTRWVKKCTALVIFCLMAAGGAYADQISDIRYGDYDGHTRVVVESDIRLDYSLFSLADQGLRVVLDLPHVRWAASARQIDSSQLQISGHGPIRRVRFGHYTADTSRLVFDLDAPLVVDQHFRLPPAAPGEPYRLVLDFAPTSLQAFDNDAGFPDKPQSVVAQSGPSVVTQETIFRDTSQRRIVVDAGHGGKDPGSIGVTGRYEKDVALAESIALKDALEALGNYEVILTRSTDIYLEHDDRIQVARERDADLFISLHADSIGKPDVRGASVYTLSKRGTQRARQKVLGNNWVMASTLNGRDPDVSGILVDLAQRETKNQSASFAEILTRRLPEAGPVLRNTHREANYYVLLAPDVPAVLLEMGYMSNRADEANLFSTSYREKLARTVASAINDYFDQRERLFAAR